MARLDVKAIVTAPQEISIPLVRGDHHEVSGVFRVCFEVSLSVFSTLLGFALSLPSLDKLHWAALAVSFFAMASFLVLSSRFAKKAREL